MSKENTQINPPRDPRKRTCSLASRMGCRAAACKAGQYVELILFHHERRRPSRSAPSARSAAKGSLPKKSSAPYSMARRSSRCIVLKDSPHRTVEGLVLAAVPSREIVADVLISSSGKTFAELPTGARIGQAVRGRPSTTASPRPELEYLDIRGNVDTRLNKLAPVNTTPSSWPRRFGRDWA